MSARFDQKAVKIGFFMEQSKIRFEINPESGEEAKLKISPKVLALTNHD